MRKLNVTLAFFALIASTNAGGQGTPPQITLFKIAGGSFNTGDRSVKLEIRTDGAAPIAYRVGERADLSGVPWKTFETTPSYTLSSTPGAKTLYVQVGSGELSQSRIKEQRLQP